MKILFIFSFVFLSNITNSQIQVYEKTKVENVVVGKLKLALTPLAELSYSVREKDTIYTLTYRDAQYTQINSYKTITFSSEGNTLNVLYDLMHKAFEVEDPKSYSVDVQLGKDLLRILGHKAMGVKGVRFVTEKAFFAPINENQLKKLFGKVSEDLPVSENP